MAGSCVGGIRRDFASVAFCMVLDHFNLSWIPSGDSDTSAVVMCLEGSKAVTVWPVTELCLRKPININRRACLTGSPTNVLGS